MILKKMRKQKVRFTILLNTPIQAKQLDLCTLNLRFLFWLFILTVEIGILNSMYTNQAAWLVLMY